MKKRTQLSIRTRRTIVVDAPRLHCPACGAEVPIVSPENAAEMIAASAADVRQLLTAGQLHAIDESPGVPLICANSVSAISADDENEI
jgi:hydrogenase maturation factor HypF (carbamoyltransferase family)